MSAEPKPDPARRSVWDKPVDQLYVISKGRADTRQTSRALEDMNVPYRIVIEPQELSEYAAVIDPAKILVLPFSNLGQGSIPARNWVWDHSLSEGAERHWILDDNIQQFYRYNHNLKIPVASGTIFRCAEDFTERYTNVRISGFQYEMFVVRKKLWPAYVKNTRVYSCILIDNSLDIRWRGRYNEDTDLSLPGAKDGQATILFNAFLAKKSVTMTMAGGNTDELYAAADGRLKMAESLVEQHPDVASITWKFGRWQHQVNYRQFRHNRLIPRPGFVAPEGVNNYGMVLRTIPEEQTRRSLRRQALAATPKQPSKSAVVVQPEPANAGEPAAPPAPDYDPMLHVYSDPDDESIDYGQLGWGDVGPGSGFADEGHGQDFT